jgi:hypothetical protein
MNIIKKQGQKLSIRMEVKVVIRTGNLKVLNNQANSP